MDDLERNRILGEEHDAETQPGLDEVPCWAETGTEPAYDGVHGVEASLPCWSAPRLYCRYVPRVRNDLARWADLSETASQIHQDVQLGPREHKLRSLDPNASGLYVHDKGASSHRTSRHTHTLGERLLSAVLLMDERVMTVPGRTGLSAALRTNTIMRCVRAGRLQTARLRDSPERRRKPADLPATQHTGHHTPLMLAEWRLRAQIRAAGPAVLTAGGEQAAVYPRWQVGCRFGVGAKTIDGYLGHRSYSSLPHHR